MVEYKVGDLSRLLQSSGTEISKSGTSFLTSKKSKVAKQSAESDNEIDTLKGKTEKKKKGKWKSALDKEDFGQAETSGGSPDVQKKIKQKKKKAKHEMLATEGSVDSQPNNIGLSHVKEIKQKKKKAKSEMLITEGSVDSHPESPHGLLLPASKTMKKAKSQSEISNSDLGKKKRKSKKGKKKLLEERNEETQSEVVHPPGYDPPPGIVHEAAAAATEAPTHGSSIKSPKKRKLEDSDSEEDVIKSSKKSKLAQEKTRMRRDRLKKKDENRTIFIGNLPVSVKKQKLLKMFKGYGEIESVRYRCLPVNDPSVPKRVIAIKGELHPDRHNCVAYICFKEEESAQKATAQNGTEVEGLHIRVDLAGKKDKSDIKKSVFVGNLPFNVEEEQLREHFEDCGTIENVRLIRDRKTCIGKGFGYIKFSDTDAVSFATKLNGSQFKKRAIRVQTCVSKPKQPKGTKDKPPSKGKPNFNKQKPGPTAKPFTSPGRPKQDYTDSKEDKQNFRMKEGKSGMGKHMIFDDDSDVKQKHGGKFKGRNDKSRKNFKGKDGKPKKKSFRPSNMKKSPFHNKLARKDTKKKKQNKSTS